MYDFIHSIAYLACDSKISLFKETEIEEWNQLNCSHHGLGHMKQIKNAMLQYPTEGKL